MDTQRVIETAQQFGERARELQTTAAELRHLCQVAESEARYYTRAAGDDGRDDALAAVMHVVGEAAQVIRQAQEIAAWLPREHTDLARAVLDGEAVAPVE